MVRSLKRTYKIGDTIEHPLYGKGQVQELNLHLATAKVELEKPYIKDGRVCKKKFANVNLFKCEQFAIEKNKNDI